MPCASAALGASACRRRTSLNTSAIALPVTEGVMSPDHIQLAPPGREVTLEEGE